MIPVELKKTILVKSKEHGGAEVTINEEDFNPEVHTKLHNKAAKALEEENETKPPTDNSVHTDVDLVPAGSASGESGQAKSRQDAIEELEKSNPAKAEAAKAGHREPVEELTNKKNGKK